MAGDEGVGPGGVIEAVTVGGAVERRVDDDEVSLSDVMVELELLRNVLEQNPSKLVNSA